MCIRDRHEAKFYSLVIAPRTDEIKHLKNDWAKLKSFTREVMDIYAENFNGKNGSKKLTGNDLIYFAKMEENRYYKRGDPQVKEGTDVYKRQLYSCVIGQKILIL